jgi:hypothetical protein
VGKRRHIKPDLDEKFSLYPMEGEDVVRRLLDEEEPESEEDVDS